MSVDGRLWRNPVYARIFFKYLLAQTINSKSERYNETRVLTLRTRRISNSLSPLPLKISAFQCAVYAVNMPITNAFPPESRETPVQHKVFKNNMTYGKIAPHVANRSASMIQLKSICALSLSTVRQYAAAPDPLTAPGWRDKNLKNVISKPMLRFKFMSFFYEIALKWIPQNILDDKSFFLFFLFFFFTLDDKSISSGDGFVSSGNTPSPELMLTQIFVTRSQLNELTNVTLITCWMVITCFSK